MGRCLVETHVETSRGSGSLDISATHSQCIIFDRCPMVSVADVVVTTSAATPGLGSVMQNNSPLRSLMRRSERREGEGGREGEQRR